MYGVQTDDIVNGYDAPDDRPLSRIGYRGGQPPVAPANDASDDEEEDDDSNRENSLSRFNVRKR